MVQGCMPKVAMHGNLYASSGFFVQDGNDLSLGYQKKYVSIPTCFMTFQKNRRLTGSWSQLRSIHAVHVEDHLRHPDGRKLGCGWQSGTDFHPSQLGPNVHLKAPTICWVLVTQPCQDQVCLPRLACHKRCVLQPTVLQEWQLSDQHGKSDTAPGSNLVQDESSSSGVAGPGHSSLYPQYLPAFSRSGRRGDS